MEESLVSISTASIQKLSAENSGKFIINLEKHGTYLGITCYTKNE